MYVETLLVLRGRRGCLIGDFILQLHFVDDCVQGFSVELSSAKDSQTIVHNLSGQSSRPDEKQNC